MVNTKSMRAKPFGRLWRRPPLGMISISRPDVPFCNASAGPCCMDQPVDAVIPCPRGLMRYGRSWGVPAPAYGSGRRQQLPLRPLDARWFVCTIAGQRSDGIINLVEQGTDLRAVIDIIGGQRRRDDPAGVGIDTDVQFAPRPAPARTVLLDQPVARPRPLPPSAVHPQLHR